MKIAICFSGQIRTGVEAAKNVKNYIGELYNNVDFYMHTWDISREKQWNPESDMSVKYNTVTFPKIKDSRPLADELNKAYDSKFKKIRIDNFGNWENSIGSNYMGYSPLWYSWQQSILLKQEYEIENNFCYDVVIKMRPDIIFPKSLSLLEEIDHYNIDASKFYAMGYAENRIDDVMFLSSSTLMDRASCFFSDVGKKYWTVNIFGEYLVSKNIECYNTKHTLYTVLRGESINCMDNFVLTFNIDRDFYADTSDRLPANYVT